MTIPWQNIFLVGALLSFGALVVIIVRAGWRPGNHVDPSAVSFSAVVRPALAVGAVGLVRTFKNSFAASYLFLLIAGRRAATVFKNVFHNLETRFSGLIEAVRGRGQKSLLLKRRGPASFFLEQLKFDRTSSRRSGRRPPEV